MARTSKQGVAVIRSYYYPKSGLISYWLVRTFVPLLNFKLITLRGALALNWSIIQFHAVVSDSLQQLISSITPA